MIAPGYKADVNVIDYDRLHLHPPKVHYDLPVGGRRLLQQVDGYDATIVSGVVTQRGGTATGARPAGWCAARRAARGRFGARAAYLLSSLRDAGPIRRGLSSARELVAFDQLTLWLGVTCIPCACAQAGRHR